MNEQEALVAEDIYEAIQRASNYSDRAMQSRDYQVGVSDLGWCSQKTRRMLAGDDPEDTDVLAAFIGTAIGKEIEQALANTWDDVILQPSVTLVLRGETRNYNVPGHPDIVRRSGVVLDGKSTYGLSVVEREGPSQSQQFQRHGYGAASFAGGLFDETVAIEDVMVGNFWVDRSARDKRVHVQMEPLDLEIVEESARWLDEVVYAYLHDQDARKEPAREICAATCGFFSTCRFFDSDVEGLLTDPKVLKALEQYAEGLEHGRIADRFKDQAKEVLFGLQGMAKLDDDLWQVRTTHVNESAPSPRRAYDKIEVRKVKR